MNHNKLSALLLFLVLFFHTALAQTDYFKVQENAITNDYNPVFVRYFSTSGTGVKKYYHEDRIKEIDVLLQQYAAVDFPVRSMLEVRGPWQSIIKEGIN
ncbi:hypothetical protein, partial [Chryseosolibacter indicus]